MPCIGMCAGVGMVLLTVANRLDPGLHPYNRQARRRLHVAADDSWRDHDDDGALHVVG